MENEPNNNQDPNPSNNSEFLLEELDRLDAIIEDLELKRHHMQMEVDSWQQELNNVVKHILLRNMERLMIDDGVKEYPRDMLDHRRYICIQNLRYQRSVFNDL